MLLGLLTPIVNWEILNAVHNAVVFVKIEPMSASGRIDIQHRSKFLFGQEEVR
jgi:hypothetical protein